MATATQMSRVAQSPAAVQSMARVLLALPDADWTDWETDFLEHMSAYDGPDPLTTRQREVLFDLDDKARRFTAWEGLSVGRLIREVHLARFDLEEDDEAFITALHTASPQSLRRRPLARLVRLARRLGIIMAN